MVDDLERREAARRLREYVGLPDDWWADTYSGFYVEKCVFGDVERHRESELFVRLADLIDPDTTTDTTKTPDLATKCDRDAEYEAWYNSLSHYGSTQGEPSTIRALVEEIVWTALTVDLGPDGNIDPSTGTDNGEVYTDKLFAEWEREALRLSGGCDRDALLRLADECDEMRGDGLPIGPHEVYRIARRIREALEVER